MPKRKSNDPARVTSDEPAARRRNIRNGLLAATTCLLVAQILLPADGTTAASGAGIPLVMLWLLLVVGWLAGSVWRDRAPVRISATDICILAMILLHTVSGLFTAGTAPRPTVNMIWQWVAIGCCYLLVRQLFTSPRECRSLAAIMIALAVGMSAYGYYQSLIEIPAIQDEYRKNPDQKIKEAMNISGQGEVAPHARRQFEARLFSQRPKGTFILANSMAGFLAPWLVLCFHIACSRNGAPARSFRQIATVVCALAIAGAVFLTHSRTALLASAFGLLLLLIWRIDADRARSARRLAIGFGAVALATAALVGALQIDHPAIVAARKSVHFRLEYWRATAAMIADSPWLGCGPGHFQDRYTAYKLPQALEEVADPHNFLLEIWATAGTFTMLALVAAIGCFFVRVNTGKDNATRQSDTVNDQVRAADKFLFFGALVGLLLALALGFTYAVVAARPDITSALIIGIAGSATVIAFWQWIDRGRLTATTIAIAAAVLLVNLCVAGGIGNPGVAVNLWVLVALGLNVSHVPSEDRLPNRRTTATAVVITLALLLGCQLTAYRPVIQADTALRQAKRLEDDGDLDAALALLRQAAAADPRAAEPRKRQAWLLFGQLLTQFRDDGPPPAGQRRPIEDEFATATSGWLQRAPDSADARTDIADMHLRAFRAGGPPSYLEAAIVYYEQAVQRYPNSATMHARLAWARYVAGDGAASAVSAVRAIELDDLQPHGINKLSSDYQRLSDPIAEGYDTRNLMEQLRNGHSIDARPASSIQ